MSNLITDLPVVQHDAIVIAGSEAYENKNFFRDLTNRIRQDNPTIINVLEQYAQESGCPREVNYGGLMTYRVLEIEGSLPRVGYLARNQARQELIEKPGDEYVMGMLEKVRDNNPTVLELIVTFEELVQKPKMLVYASMITYGLLEKQACLNKIFNEPHFK